MRWANRYVLRASSPLLEANSRTLKRNEAGGIIIFSMDVNATVQDASAFTKRLRQWWESLKNRLTHRAKGDWLVKRSGVGVGGYSIGNYFRGRYVSNSDKVFDERSLAIEILFIDCRQLVDLATEVCLVFQQESVLIKDNGRVEFYFVDRR
ncbi:MAG: hypothetical protein PHV34_08810 [Verrucomicrobiae bacterium]|nr:hypothetical protein [Verrucomicrobiae bacterium]